MTSADEYQRYAAECLEWARKAKTEAERKAFLDMARAWTQAGAKLNGGVIPIDVTTPDDDGTGPLH
jgi:hypothetical protein